MLTIDRIKWAEKECDRAISLIDDANDPSLVVRKSIVLSEVIFKEVMNTMISNVAVNPDIVKDTFDQLMDGLPITHLTGKDDEWEEATKFDDGVISYRNKRYKKLVKFVHPDGREICYEDNLAMLSVKNENGSRRRFGYIPDMLINELIPIRFPYMPAQSRYIFLADEFSVESEYKNYIHVTKLLDTHSGGSMNLDRYFWQYWEKPDNEDSYLEITKEEYEKEREKWMREKEDNMERTQEETSQSE